LLDVADGRFLEEIPVVLFTLQQLFLELQPFEFGRGGVWVLQPPYLLFYPDANRDDVPDGKVTDFRKSVNAKDDEEAVLAFFEYPDKAARDAANEKMRSDSRMTEVGVDPRLGDGGVGYRARVAEQIASGRAFARFEDGEVVFKAEIGALSSRVGQIQGVWVRPDRRGCGLGAAGTAAVVDRLIAMSRVASLYVNGYNSPARAAYARVGFSQIASFATVLF